MKSEERRVKNLFYCVTAVLSIPLMIAGLAGCYPDNSASVDDLDIVITSCDTGYDFSGVRTYIMADTVVAITDSVNPENNFGYAHTYDSLILAGMTSNLEALGYMRVYDTVFTAPDIRVRLMVTSTTNPDNNGFYPWPAGYTFTLGSLIATMSDQHDSAVWMGAINGLVEGSNINNRIGKGIDQMFLQSPYL